MVIVSYLIGNVSRTQELASIAQAYTGCPLLRTGNGGLKNLSPVNSTHSPNAHGLLIHLFVYPLPCHFSPPLFSSCDLVSSSTCLKSYMHVHPFLPICIFGLLMCSKVRVGISEDSVV